MVRMNYELDEEAYQLFEVSEGYISRLYVPFRTLPRRSRCWSSSLIFVSCALDAPVSMI